MYSAASHAVREDEVLFELLLERVLHTTWENWGTTDIRPRYRRWQDAQISRVGPSSFMAGQASNSRAIAVRQKGSLECSGLAAVLRSSGDVAVRFCHRGAATVRFPATGPSH